MFFCRNTFISMKAFLSTIFTIFALSSLAAQHDIEFQIANYPSDTVVVGYYILDKQLVHDTLIGSEGKFAMQGDENMSQGVYLLLLQPNNDLVQFLITEEDQKFKGKFDFNNLSLVDFEGSPDNELFQGYINYLAEIRPRADILRDTLQQLKDANLDYSEFEKEMLAIDEAVASKQNEILENHPESLSAILIKANTQINLPEFEDTEEGRMSRYLYYKKHYFDNIELGNSKSLRTPFLFQRIEYYLQRLTPNHPDSIIQSIDSLLHWMSPSQEITKYYLSHFLNSYASSKIVGYDAIYVHIADNYYAEGKATWVEEENLEKILDNANKIRPVLIGKIAEDITVFDEFEQPIKLSDIEYEYLVLLFWSPDCPHCKKTMPAIVEFDKKYREEGVRTFAICTKHKDKVNDCWEYVDEKDMAGFINAADKYHRSRFKIKYNVQTTPKIFILDKNREIIMKNIGGDQLERVMSEIIKKRS